MAITKIASLAFRRRYRQILRYEQHTPELQQKQLEWLLHKGLTTKYATENGFRQLSDFPVCTYDEIKPYIERMLKGESNVLWPGRCMWFAKSSGTTSDKSKYIPVTKDALKLTHYRGGTDSLVIYLALNPASKLMNNHGKALMLGGSFSSELLPYGIHAGDLSATLIQNVNPMVNYIRTPNKEVALMNEWETKLQALCQSTRNDNVTSLSGVPSWMMGVLKEQMRQTGAKDITEIWPNLEVFFHGGIAFTPYREQYRKLIPSDNMHYLETYNASEGFFGIQSSWDDTAMQLIVDNRTYYEFIPMSDYQGSATAPSKIIPLKDIEVGVNYAMVITTPGLWRYIIGDTVRFTQKDPYKFHISGRTAAFINAFGEELMVSNADEALTKTCAEFGCEVSDYTAGPVFAVDNRKAHHHWVIEFNKEPADPEAFADALDRHLQEVNSDYEAKRYKGIFLERLALTIAPAGTFNQWLKQRKGKLGGQIKIPRLSNSDSYIKELQIIIRR